MCTMKKIKTFIRAKIGSFYVSVRDEGCQFQRNNRLNNWTESKDKLTDSTGSYNTKKIIPQNEKIFRNKILPNSKVMFNKKTKFKIS